MTLTDKEVIVADDSSTAKLETLSVSLMLKNIKTVNLLLNGLVILSQNVL